MSGVYLPIILPFEGLLGLDLFVELCKLLVFHFDDSLFIGKCGLLYFVKFLSFQDFFATLELLLVELVVVEFEFTFYCCDVWERGGFRVDVILLHFNCLVYI